MYAAWFLLPWLALPGKSFQRALIDEKRTESIRCVFPPSVRLHHTRLRVNYSKYQYLTQGLHCGFFD